MSTNTANADLAYSRAGLYDGVGDFWSNVFQDRAFIAGLAAGANNLTAQLFQKYIETGSAVGVHSIPAYRRRRWHLVTLSSSTRNKAPALSACVGASPVQYVGPQPAGTHEPGDVPVVGGYLTRPGYVGYAYDGPESVLIQDRLTAPTRILRRGVDYVTLPGTILFKTEHDPFTGSFYLRDRGDGVQEVALWLRDAEVDEDFLWRFGGYALDARDETSEWYKRYISTLFALAQSGGTAGALLAHIYAALDLPYATVYEDVVAVTTDAESIVVSTDARVYEFAAALGCAVSPGDVIKPYAPMTTAMRLIHGEELIDFAVPLPENKSRGVNGRLLAQPTQTDLYCVGLDVNGNPRFRFALTGNDSDVAAFWRGVDVYAQVNNIDQTDYYRPYLYSERPVPSIKPQGSIRPARFFVDLYYAPGTQFLVVDVEKLSADGRRGFGLLMHSEKYLPPWVALVVLASLRFEDVYEQEAVDKADVYALQRSADAVLPASDRVTTYLVPVCKGGVRW